MGLYVYTYTFVLIDVTYVNICQYVCLQSPGVHQVWALQTASAQMVQGGRVTQGHCQSGRCQL